MALLTFSSFGLLFYIYKLNVLNIKPFILFSMVIVFIWLLFLFPELHVLQSQHTLLYQIPRSLILHLLKIRGASQVALMVKNPWTEKPGGLFPIYFHS